MNELDKTLIEALSSLNYHVPTPIQLKTIRNINTKQHILAEAKNGTGKTLAFCCFLF